MNFPLSHCTSKHLLTAVLGVLLLVANTPAIAAPGAHGPNGEHLDSPAATRAASALPRLETMSDAFELVATLHAGELSVLIDRFATNEPVLNATLEIESDGLKAVAKFHADQGDYAFDEPKLLALLRSPGEHALVFTLVAGTDSDLLDGTLVTAAGVAAVATKGEHGHGHDNTNSDHDHSHELERVGWIGTGVAALALIVGIAWWRKRRHNASKLQGTL